MLIFLPAMSKTVSGIAESFSLLSGTISGTAESFPLISSILIIKDLSILIKKNNTINFNKQQPYLPIPILFFISVEICIYIFYIFAKKARA